MKAKRVLLLLPSLSLTTDPRTTEVPINTSHISSFHCSYYLKFARKHVQRFSRYILQFPSLAFTDLRKRGKRILYGLL